MMDSSRLCGFLPPVALMAGAPSFWGIWVGMEVFNMLFVPLMTERQSFRARARIFIFLVIQVVSTAILLVSFLALSIVTQVFSILGMFFKLGVAPIHYWMFWVVESMAWTNLAILMSLAKVGGLTLMYLISPPSLILPITLAGLFIPLSALASSSLRLIMTASTVHHTSWVLLAWMMASGSLTSYLLAYWSVLWHLCDSLSSNNTLKDLTKMNWLHKSTVMILILSVAGFPPLVGWFPKLLVTFNLLSLGLWVLALVAVGTSMIPFYFYLKIFVTSFLSALSSKKSFSILYSLTGLSWLIYTISMQVLLPLTFLDWLK
uniref:NADH dehydrogenase subunit 2 n=1 Tax=Austromenopon paululum TaxID=2965261 RepID=UPI0026E39EF3|nr:NADH dehydrogenase subunit 2 [Austromenopon paululum]WJJ69869.1 NADH dehydrogenase subunit 2 [Austromenopon paululum]